MAVLKTVPATREPSSHYQIIFGSLLGFRFVTTSDVTDHDTIDGQTTTDGKQGRQRQLQTIHISFMQQQN